MKNIGLILLLISAFNLKAQELNIGLSTGFTAYQNIKWEKAWYKPENSYHIYIEDSLGQGLLNKHGGMNGVNLGGLIGVKYKRFTFNIEPQFYYQKTYIYFYRPFLVERSLGKRAFRMPLYGTFKLFKSPKSFFLLAGVAFSKERNWEFQNPGINYFFGDDNSFDQQFEIGNDHFEGELYDNRGYYNYIVGIGKTGKRWNGSVRVQRKIDITKHKITAKTFQVEIAFNYVIFTSKDFTKKHFLYED